VFNTEGEVVGVNTAIFSPNGGSVGIGFAIPSNQVRAIVDELKTSGSIDRGWLGVQLQNIDDDLAASLGLEHNEGALVADVVPDSPAANAGLAVGDVIVSYDGRDVGDARELARMVGASDGGDKVKLGVVRDATEIRIKVTLGDADTKVASTGSGHQLENLGMTLAPMNEETRRRLGMDSELSGALVVKVDPNGEAANQGIRRGDVLIQANRNTIESPSDFRKALSKAKKNGRDSVPVLVRRGDAQQFVSLPVA